MSTEYSEVNVDQGSEVTIEGADQLVTDTGSKDVGLDVNYETTNETNEMSFGVDDYSVEVDEDTEIQTEVQTDDATYEKEIKTSEDEVEALPEDTPKEESEEEQVEESEVEQLRRELEELKEKQARDQFFDKFGSEEEYNELVGWASENLPEDMISGYDELIQKESLTPDMQFALANLLRSHMKLQTQDNSGGRLLVGENSQTVSPESKPIVTEEDFIEAFSNPLYKHPSPEGQAYTLSVNKRAGMRISSR